MAAIGAAVTVVKLNAHGREVFRYGATLTADDGREITLHSRWQSPARDVGYVFLERDDRWTERFYRDRWYNIFEIRSSAGQFKGWYCNICRPAELADGELRCIDLELDLFVAPDRCALRLDEVEFEALGLREREPAAYRESWAALLRLEEMARLGQPPFDSSSPAEPPGCP